MSCWCGHGPWHYHGYPYPPAYGPPPGAYYPPGEPYGYGRRRRRRADAEELSDYLQELEAELARVRHELDELRATGTSET